MFLGHKARMRSRGRPKGNTSFLLLAWASLTKVAPPYHTDYANDPAYVDYWGEFGTDIAVASTPYGASPQTTGTLFPYPAYKQVPIDYTYKYDLSAGNGNWSTDETKFTFEFVNSSGATVAAIYLRKDINYSHLLYYGTTIGSAVSSGKTGSYGMTNGVVRFNPTSLTFASEVASNRTNSFTINCAAQTITHVRISDVLATNTWPLGGNCYSYFRKAGLA